MNKLWKNNAADLDAESTVIVFAESEQKPAINGDWVECSRAELESFACISQLFIQGGVRYYGFL